MDRDKILERLEELTKSTDPEAAHVEADEILENLLIELGYEDVIKLYRDVPAWYA